MNDPISSNERAGRASGFTLVELLVSMGIISLLLLILVQMTNQTSRLWMQTSGKVEQFRAAREAFESMTRNLSQATLNTYWDYDNPTVPKRFIRQSELRFISGPMTGGSLHLATTTPPSPKAWPGMGTFFFAPLGVTGDTTATGLPNLLNTVGYFVEFDTDRNLQPSFLQGIVSERYRFRLMEMRVPSEKVYIYNRTSGLSGANSANLTYAGKEWFNNFLINPVSPTAANPTTVRVIAENVISLILLPHLSPKDEKDRLTNNLTEPLCRDYYYDSTYFNSLSSPSSPPASEAPRYSSNDPGINPTAQLPPVMQVAMIAIDEPSAQRLATINKTAMPDLDSTDNLFQDSTKLFDDPATPDPGDGDLHKLEKFLINQKLSYRTFSAGVAIRGAKWSREQVK